MVVLVPGPAALDTKIVNCWTTNDDNLGLFVVFMGQSTTTNVTQSSSRIQAHILSIGGLQSFPRLTINPSSALYDAVNYLPEEDQGDEVRRGLAVSLLKYFTEMHKAVRLLLGDKLEAVSSQLFNAAHAAALASNMVQASNGEEIADCIRSGMAERSLSWIDIDVVLPDGSISLIKPQPLEGRGSLVPLPDLRPEVDYGKYNSFVDLLGEVAFLPTSSMRRAPSKPTAVSKTRVLDREKEDGLRREIQEMVSTEQSYVSKLSELVDSIAASYARNIKEKPGRKLTPGDQAMKTLFPPSLSRILAFNEQFLQSISSLVDSTRSSSGNYGRSSRDPTGALGFSKMMLEFFPHFKEPYQDFLRKSGNFPKILADLVKDKNTPWANAIFASGEQRLKSWLIEPVQRLPRYSLFIDNMVNLLPADHPAMSRFLRARDIVTEICALENDEPINSFRVVQRLRETVSGWPEGFEPRGRLITAADSIQLPAPFAPDPYGLNGLSCVLLLFSDQLIVLEKTGKMSARGLLAEIDRPTGSKPAASAANPTAKSIAPFAISSSVPLVTCRILESNSGRLLHVDGTSTSYDGEKQGLSSTYDSSDVYQLLGSYEGKAAKLGEEIAMANIEDRFPEQIREDESWTLKSLPQSKDSLGIITATFEANCLKHLYSSGNQPGRIRMVVGRSSKKSLEEDSTDNVPGSEITIYIPSISDDKVAIELTSYGRQVSADSVAVADFANALKKRISYVLRLHQLPYNSKTAHASIGLARDVLLCLQPMTHSNDVSESISDAEREDARKFRPLSPVKGLSSLLGGSSKAGSPSKPFSGLRRGNSVKSRIAAAKNISSQPGSREDLTTNSPTDRFVVETGKSAAGKDPANMLETAFNTYIVALQIRKGNIVGRVIHNRANADELLVNELYNSLMENPVDHKAAAEVPVDVLFAAFEKFLNNAWQEQFGKVVLPSVLNDMQSLLFSEVPGMVQQFKSIMSEMSRENQRAFRSLVGVLSELVGATQNDGDRGALIMTFAETLVVEGDAAEYIMLIDRLLADADLLFGLQVPEPLRTGSERTRATNTGSVGSTTSSIGKKFGFFGGLSRGNSKSSESESRVAHVLRQLSKRSNADTDSTPPSISRSLLSRGRSADSRPTTPGSSPSRPGSSYSGRTQESPRPGSAHGLLKSLAPIEERKMGPPKVPVRKKRRSSLSDLTDLRQPKELLAGASSVALGDRKIPTLQKTPSSSSVMNRVRPDFFGEIPPLALHARGRGRNLSPNEEIHERNTKSPTPSIITTTPRDVPNLAAGATPDLSPAKSRSASPQKLKVQSPQKLRERLEREKQALVNAGPELQAELLRIGEQLSSVKVSGSQQSPRSVLEELRAKVNALEGVLRMRLDNMGQQTDEIKADLESSLIVSEKKSKNLDDLYREANAENELLYDRFNGEIGKILKSVKGSTEAGQGVQEMQRVMQEAQDEAARLRKENQRLKRENLGLRSQLRDA